MSEVTTARPSTTSALSGAFGVLLLLLAWQGIAASKWFGDTITAPSVVLRQFRTSDQRTLLLDAARATGLEALQGFGWALLAAALFGMLATLVPMLRRGIDQLATIESAVPFLALAPILLALVSRDTIPAAMGATTAFFPLYIAIVSGLQSVSPSVKDLCTVLGSKPRTTLVRARIPAAIPVVTTGIKVAMPLAIVGAVIGEWLGASAGLGPIMLVAMRNYEMPTMWAAVTITVVVALLLYGLCALVDRLLAPRFS
jgi:ABC-type nitrate/sulfonate/bicarbonate transport system permease component